MASESVDLIFSLFAPYSEEEFLRVLKKGGVLIRAVPLTDHLYSLKEAVYEKPTRNVSEAAIGSSFLTFRIGSNLSRAFTAHQDQTDSLPIELLSLFSPHKGQWNPCS